jgi:hypothetical protein
MSEPENIGEQLRRIEVQDQSPDSINVEVKRGIGQRVLSKIGMDEATMQEARIMRANQAQNAQDTALNNAPHISHTPAEQQRTEQLRKTPERV